MSALCHWTRGSHRTSPGWGPDTDGPDEYFPERTLARWLHRNQLPSTVYAFPLTGVRPLRDAYVALIDALSVDGIVLIDGGTDILCRGDEAGLGTPHEDSASLAAVAGVDVPVKLVTAVGFGIDAYHGVNHVQILENIADLDAVADAISATPARPSIVHGQIAAAIRGRHGNVPLSERTRASSLFVNPLMSMYFTVDLDGLANRHLYLDRIEHTASLTQVALAIEEFRYDQATRPPRVFPH